MGKAGVQRAWSFLGWAGLAALVGCGGPSVPVSPEDSAPFDRSLKTLALESPAQLSIHRGAKGELKSLYGVLSPGGGRATGAMAREFIRDRGMAFRVNQPEQLELLRGVDSPGGQHFLFQQRFEGVVVDGAQVSVHYDGAGQVVAVHSTFVPSLRLASVTPRLSASRAKELAYAQLDTTALHGSEGFEAQSDLVVHVQDGQASLAWKVTALTDGPTWEIVVDAQDGQVLVPAHDVNVYATGTGKIWIGANAVVATRNNALKDSSNAASAVPASAYQTVTLQGLNGNTFLDGTYASSSATRKRASSATNAFLFDRSNGGFEETMAYFHIDNVQRYIQSLGFANVNNRQQVFAANGSTQDNSWYTPSTRQITYGSGGVDDAEDAEVIDHEYGHSIQDNQVPGFGSGNEAGAQGEGFGDYLAATVNAQTSGGFQDVCIMEWDATSYSTSNPPCLRRLDSTKHYPESVQNEVHADGEMWASTLWQIRGSLGAARADKLVIQHHFLLSSSTTFNASSDALITAAKNLGYTSAECAAVKTHLQNRGFTVTALCP